MAAIFPPVYICCSPFSPPPTHTQPKLPHNVTDQTPGLNYQLNYQCVDSRSTPKVDTRHGRERHPLQKLPCTKNTSPCLCKQNRTHSIMGRWWGPLSVTCGLQQQLSTRPDTTRSISIPQADPMWGGKEAPEGQLKSSSRPSNCNATQDMKT